MSTLDLSLNQVHLVPHQTDWAAIFTDEAASIRSAVGEATFRIEHVRLTILKQPNPWLFFGIYCILTP